MTDGPVVIASPEHQTVRLREFEATAVPADALLAGSALDAYDSLDGKGYFEVRVRDRKLHLSAGGYVGIIPINDRLTLEVVPRVPMSNLSRLLEVSRQAPRAVAGTTRSYARGGRLYPSLVSIYAQALTDQIETVAARGLLKEYERREETTSFPHGRVLAGRTLQRTLARGEAHRVVAGWFQRTIDVAANQCIKFAVHRLSQFAYAVRDSLPEGERRRVMSMLNRCDHMLAGVSLDSSQQFLRDPYVTGSRPLPPLRSYYRPALDVATLIISGQAVTIEGHGEHVRLPSMLVKMSDVFESYLRELLNTEASAEGWPVRVLNGNQHAPHGAAKKNLLDSGTAVEATPDIVLAAGRPPHSTCKVLIEVKYKPAKKRPDRDDLDQTIAYGVSYKAKHLVLVQPQAGKRTVPAGLRQFGSLSGMDVWVYVIDLENEDLTAQEAAWCKAIRGLAA